MTTRPAALSPLLLLTAEELGLHLHCSRESAVAWARERGLAMKGPGAATLYELAEINAALRKDRDIRRGEPPRPVRRRDGERRVSVD